MKPQKLTPDMIEDPKMRELLFGAEGPFDESPPVLPMLKKWTGSPRFHLDTFPRKPETQTSKK